MKKIKIFITLLLLSSLSITAQNKYTQTADKHFDKFEFVEAIAAYNKLVEKGQGDAYVYTKLAEANYNIFSTTEAEKWYAKALESSQDAEMMYKYSQMLKANGKYDASNQWMHKFAKANPKDDRAKAFLANQDYLPGILEGVQKYELESLGFNSEASDFGGTLKDGVLYFTSARNNARRTYGWNEEPFLDIYQVAVSEGDNAEAEPVKGSINTKYHEGLVTFSPDGNTMYFSRESFYDGVYEKIEDSKTKISVIHLFKATKSGDSWKNVKALPFNSDSYSVKNPSLSVDGKTLYFASDMPGGFGKYDIYKATVNADGSFGDPENLGAKVNTEGQEMFPFISDNGTLYFSSNGHLGLGGLDVFYTTASGDVVNAGAPINSNSDDLAFTINEETGEGFVSSNREGGQGSDDIYAVKRLKPCNVLVTTTVVNNETDTPLAGVTVTIKDVKGQVLATETSNAEGKVSYTVPCENALLIAGSLEDFESNSIDFAGSKEETMELILPLDPIEKIIVEDRVVLNPILFDFDKSNITAQGAFELDKLVAVMKKYPEMVILAESHTDNRGSARYNEKLSSRRAQSTVQYVISKGIDASRITGVGKGESDLRVNCGSKCTEEEHQLNRRSEFIIVSGGPNQQ
ncbi:outer membrane protein OmpA-like peptidoglycan-associated protein [Oceanihabitans sediminis]|uniref:Cell envelope biogenesis protein OmpA n=2 Tax=Pseudomonadati TaxID=3379134 RepID=A0A368P7N2_9FLAO|nr:OmpA family protein [Oceanihabitans sediminis]RBP34908.1 outer membrane protein OmpA-like peptidoglycan-associated protein [Oceanihabitans sediminis]RCU58548.1 cell envelope biogenesis protein OmpA [Oceanihabitans sediminis]